MNDNEELRQYGDSTILEPIVEQLDDEITTTTPMSNSSTNTSFTEEEERRAREEIQQFEELEKEFASHRHGIRVKFDDERFLPITQTTVIKTEPYFQINSTEDQVTKHFYENDDNNKQLSRQTSSKTPSELDSLEEEYIVTFQEKDLSFKPNDNHKEIYHKIIDHSDEISFSPPGKSILKKSPKKEKNSPIKYDRSSISRSPSPTSLKKKSSSSSIRSDSNEIQHLAEVTSKQTLSQSSPPFRSLFEPTINIFDTSNSTYQNRRPSRLRYYIKPYRGEAYIQPDKNTQRSRSLSEQRLAQQTNSPVWHTFSNQYNRQSNRKQHISWSPVREDIHQGKEKIDKPSTKIKKSSSTNPSVLSSTLSSSSPCLRSSSSMIPISIRYGTFQKPQLDSSTINHSLTSTSQNNYSLPDIVHPNKKEHNQTMERYDRLLEKMRATDEQLQSLSRSWINNVQQNTLNKSNLSLNKTTNNKELFSPIFLQTCLIILVIFNLIFMYFFNEINSWWNRYVTQTVIAEQHDEGTSKFK